MSGTVSNEVIDDIREIMGSTDPILLFGANEKRARLRYRRLMRSVHPDTSHGVPDAEEATRRLNALWEAYQRMTAGGGDPDEDDGTGDGATEDRNHFVHEMTRTNRFVIFAEGDRWLVVDRHPTTRPRPTNKPDIRPLADILVGSPVRMAEVTGEKEICQRDGNHHAVTCKVPEFHIPEHHLMSLMDIKHHVPNGTTEPEDVAWILKRCLFLVAAMAKARLALPADIDLADAVAVDIEAHVLMLVAPHEIMMGTGNVDEQRRNIATMLEILMRLVDLTDGRRASRRLMAFMRGIGVDRVTETADLLVELNDLLFDVFGETRFHEMRIV